MNEKITHQIEEMKKQTIGVEVEMNSITRVFGICSLVSNTMAPISAAPYLMKTSWITAQLSST